MEFEVRNQISNDYNKFFYAIICHVCKRFGDGVHLKRCGGCRMIVYCGKQHQKEHWKQHKPLCKAIQDVLQEYSLDDRGKTSGERGERKMVFSMLVSYKLGRQLRNDERQMIYCRRECLVCYEQNAESLEDCQKCAASFCKNHKNSIKHRNICAPLELRFCSDLLAMREESDPVKGALNNSYLQHVSDTSTFQNMKDFINAFGDIQTDSETAYNILAGRHSYHLSYPLTLLHAMRLLNYEPKRKDLVIHVVGATDVEEVTWMGWEVFPRLIKNVMSVIVIMIGSELKRQFNPSHICDKCRLREKKCLMFEFHDVLYENYVCSSLFVKPDLIVGFNLVYELSFKDEMRAATIQVLAKQNCPFVLTCFSLMQFQQQIDRINAILGRKVDYLYSDKNPFACLIPLRNYGLKYLIYFNQYVTIYRSLCS